MNIFHAIFLFLALHLLTPSLAHSHSFHYLTPESVDFKTLLPAPPSIGSDETKKEIEFLLQRIQSCTPDELAAIKNEEKISIWPFFRGTLGTWFAPEKIPVTADFLKNVEKDSRAVTSEAKKSWNRPRPPYQDSRIKPLIMTPINTSYPSGHSTAGTLYARVLADLVPDKKEALLNQGRQIGEHRLSAGVHFPSDVAAGRILGNEIYNKLCASPSFQADLKKAKEEIQRIQNLQK